MLKMAKWGDIEDIIGHQGAWYFAISQESFNENYGARIVGVLASAYLANVASAIKSYIHFLNYQRFQTKTGVAPLTLRHSA